MYFMVKSKAHCAAGIKIVQMVEEAKNTYSKHYN